MQRRFYGFFYAVLLLAALALGGYAWQQMQSASVIIQWSTASEFGAVGYHIYRAETPQGEAVRINPALIPARGDPQAGGEYEYVDSAATPGVTYYYYLEDVDGSGNVNRHGPLEVNAGRRGVWELALAGGLLAIAIAGLVALRGDRRPAAGRRSEPGEGAHG